MKIKKEKKMMEIKKETKIKLTVLIFLLLLISFFIAGSIATNSSSSNNANLTIWDDTDNEGGNQSKYTYGLTYPTKTSTHWNVFFYANYTNSTGNPINDSFGNCTIIFNETGTWTGWFNMSYNASSLVWQYNRTFTYKGILPFQVNCTNQSDSLSVIDNVKISNTIPVIKNKNEVSGEMPGISCSEDILCTYNFSVNVSEHDVNDVLVYLYDVANTTLTNFTLNSSTGILEINVTRDENTGNKDFFFEIKDSNNAKDSAKMPITITAVNDAPVFVGLQNELFNMSWLFEKIINVTDEENNIPFVLNITFLNCSVAQWSTRNCSNSSGRELFNSSQYSFNSTASVLNISFTPERNDVGSYIINFSVMDNSSLGNKTTSQIVNFTVLNINSFPYFTYVCNNETNTTENSQFTCWINATDIDETNNLTFVSNYSWFTFNNSAPNITVSVNITTNYSASVMINFTPTDIEVGNWSVNITVIDTGSPVGRNSTIFWFFINNTEDNVTLDTLANQTLYENKTIYVNATDNDLLVPQKNIKNETLTFASNTSWVSISRNSSSGNHTTAKIEINYNYAFSNLGVGNYTINVNVTDTANNFASRNFTIRILGDTPVVWNETMANTVIIYENNLTYLNFSQNVTDAENDNIIFSFTNDSSFPSFNISATTGIINFTAIDEDVGYHNVTINASDGKLDSLRSFNFTVRNVNDVPYIEKPILQQSVINATVDSNSNINATEDNVTTIILWVQDDDFKIPSGQKSFYNENLTLNLTIEGQNISLFSFVRDPNWPPISGANANRSRYYAIFTPRKSDVGSYNITINVTDLSNASDVLQFNLTITAIIHAPVLMTLTNQTSAVNRNFYYRINATDIEDGSSTTLGNTNFTFTYNFTSGINIFNSSTFNSTTGVINITFNSSQGGKYHLNITVNDTSGAEDSGNFWIYVYNNPNITIPTANYVFNLVENTGANLTFNINHSVGDNLTYEFYIMNSSGSNVLRYNISYYGNSSNLTWQFTPNLTDETYNSARNLTLIVYPSTSELVNKININTSYSWNITINHTNAPVVFSGYIGDTQADYNHVITINLGNYFSDIDYSDSHYNQTINFSVSSNSTPSYIVPYSSVSNWTLTLSSLIAVKELLNITATDLNESNVSLTSAISNSFEVQFTTPSTTSIPTPGGGGGGGTRSISLKIEVPSAINLHEKGKIEIPISLNNNGQTEFKDVSLTGYVLKNSVLSDIKAEFNKDYFNSILSGEKENVTLTINIESDEIAAYEVVINASSKSPIYNVKGVVYLNFIEKDPSGVKKMIIFTEDMIVENPECLELKEMAEDARRAFEEGRFEEAIAKANKAVEACRESIAGPKNPVILSMKNWENILIYLGIGIILSVILGLIFSIHKKIRFRKK